MLGVSFVISAKCRFFLTATCYTIDQRTNLFQASNAEQDQEMRSTSKINDTLCIQRNLQEKHDYSQDKKKRKKNRSKKRNEEGFIHKAASPNNLCIIFT